jgi:hypothetical protein
MYLFDVRMRTAVGVYQTMLSNGDDGPEEGSSPRYYCRYLLRYPLLPLSLARKCTSKTPDVLDTLTHCCEEIVLRGSGNSARKSWAGELHRKKRRLCCALPQTPASSQWRRLFHLWCSVSLYNRGNSDALAQSLHSRRCDRAFLSSTGHMSTRFASLLYSC